VRKRTPFSRYLFYYLYNVNAASMLCGYSVVVHIRDLKWGDTKLRRTRYCPGRTRFERVTSRDLSHSYRTIPTKNVESPEHGTLSLLIRYSVWVPPDCAKTAWWTRITRLAYVASGEGLQRACRRKSTSSAHQTLIS